MEKVWTAFIFSYSLSLAIAAITRTNEHPQHNGTTASPWSVNNLLRRDHPVNLTISLEKKTKERQTIYLFFSPLQDISQNQGPQEKPFLSSL